MKLSEAILLGSMMGAQELSGHMFGEGDSSCALGAAVMAVSSSRDEYATALIIKQNWPWLSFFRFVKITILNDWLKWPRERIAEWVSTIEPAGEPANADVTGEREAEVVSSVPCGQE